MPTETDTQENTVAAVGAAAPIASRDVVVTDEDTTVSIAPLANDLLQDEDGPLSLVGVSGADNGSVADNGDGTVSYTPNADFNGDDSFDYTVSNSLGETASGRIVVRVVPVNDAPVLEDDSFTIDEDGLLKVDQVELLGNDSDADDEDLVITELGDAANGRTFLGTVGRVHYEPDADFNGTDSFTYTVVDESGATSTATVNVTVNSVNDRPETTNDELVVDEDSSGSIAVLANDSDPEGNGLSLTGFSQGDNGSVSDNGDGTLTYTPEANFNGTDRFTYTVADGDGGTANASVVVQVNSVNDVPVLEDDSFTIDEDELLKVDQAELLDNDSDEDGDDLLITELGAPENGVTFLGAVGRVHYQPNEDFNGTDSFTYTVVDESGATQTATVTVTVDPVNDDPEAEDDMVTIDEDTNVLIDVLANDTDVDSETLSLSSVEGAENGTATITDNQVEYRPDENFNGSETLTYTIVDGDGGESEATLEITLDPVNDAPEAEDDEISVDEDDSVRVAVAELFDNDEDIDEDDLSLEDFSQGENGSVDLEVTEDGQEFLRYTPVENFNGTDSFTYTVADGNGGSTTATVEVNVEAVNDPVTVEDDEATVAEDGSVLIDVLANDSDIDGDALRIASISGAENGTVRIEDGQILYTPDEDFNGEDTFTYEAGDNNDGRMPGTVTVTVTPENDAPEGGEVSAETLEDTSVDIDVLAAAEDIDGDDLSVSEVSQPGQGEVVINEDGSVTFTPAENDTGTRSFTATVVDGDGASAVVDVEVEITGVNDDPVAEDDSFSVNEDSLFRVDQSDLLANDTDIDGDDLVIIDVSGGTNGTAFLGASGRVNYQPDENFTGEDSFTYTIDDGNGGTAEATVTITVDPVNDDPSGSDISASVDEDGTLTLDIISDGGFDDADGDDLALADVGSASNGSVSQAGNSVTYTPDENFNGSDSFGVTVTDGNGGATEATVNVTVNPVNDEPVAIDDVLDLEVGESVLGFNPAGNDTDVDGDTLRASSLDGPDSGRLSGGQFFYLPDADFEGTETFTYTVTDGSGGSADGTITVNVGGGNTPADDADAQAAGALVG